MTPIPTLIAIPARLQSSRLPRKLLLTANGKTILEHVFQQAKQSKKATKIIIATDSPEILQHAKNFGAEAYLTSPNHKSGTERIAEIVQKFPQYPLVLNLQGDEPQMPPHYLDLLIEHLQHNPHTPAATLAAPISNPHEIQNPNNVKVVLNTHNEALYFSRSPIPYPRCPNPLPIYQHIGLYGFQRNFLLKLVQQPPTPLEITESLEQLRILELGYKISVLPVPYAPQGIDTQEDYLKFSQTLTQSNS